MFTQQPPILANQWRDDRMLRSFLARALPPDLLAAHLASLDEFGEKVATEWWPQIVADYANEPKLVPFDAYGNRVDRVELSRFWQEAPAIAARWGLVAHGYDATMAQHARVVQFAFAYLFTASSEIYSCPLAMTDGAARALLESGNRVLIDRAVPHFTSRDPEQFWTSGQWMTETTGGSDVSHTETIAKPDIGADGAATGRWRLHGRKWFTSAVVADAALTLARPEGAGPGGDHLALFYVEPRKADGRFRNIEVGRLKPKLGTRKLPTAEIFLQGAPAHLVGEAKHGVRQIAPMLNVTRLWNAIAAISLFRRGLALARDYATRRVVFNAPLADQPLHQETLASLQAELEGMFHLTFYAIELLGCSEHAQLDDAQKNLLRLLTPIVKLSTAKAAVAGLSEVCECFGGAGYIEDTGIPTLLRDAQVLPIWEGTTNVLSLDVLRVLGQIGGLNVWLSALRTIAHDVTHPPLEPVIRAVRESATKTTEWLVHHSKSKDGLAAGARGLALTLGRILAAALLARHAQWSHAVEHDPRPTAAARRFVAHGLLRLHEPGDGETRMLASDIFA